MTQELNLGFGPPPSSCMLLASHYPSLGLSFPTRRRLVWARILKSTLTWFRRLAVGPHSPLQGLENQGSAEPGMVERGGGEETNASQGSKEGGAPRAPFDAKQV